MELVLLAKQSRVVCRKESLERIFCMKVAQFNIARACAIQPDAGTLAKVYKVSLPPSLFVAEKKKISTL